MKQGNCRFLTGSLFRMETITINISNIKSIQELHQLLKFKLNFPLFYGMNWAAFRDSITRLVQIPDLLEIIGLERFSKTFQRMHKFLLNV